MRLQRAELPLQLDSSEAAHRFFASCFSEVDSGRETLWVAHVDRQGRCIHLSGHQGDASGADLPIRAIVADVLLRGSAGLLLAHNHPSGDPRPSLADCRATRRLAEVADAINCRLIDHLVFAGAGYSSFRDLGLL